MNLETLFLVGSTVVLVTLITSVTVYNYHESNLIAEGIAAGVDPQKVACAYDLYSHCDVLAAQTITYK